MINNKLKDKSILLASKSPRRHYLLKELGLEFEILVKDGIEEDYPENILNKDVALYLANLKADAYTDILEENSILITADTIVLYNDEILEKPTSRQDAIDMIKKISGSKHIVVTGVVLKSLSKTVSFDSFTNVFFRELSIEEIEYYIDTFMPFDKAGAYGIQEWIGYIGIEKIEGSYFNVMGLPVQKLYEELKNF